MGMEELTEITTDTKICYTCLHSTNTLLDLQERDVDDITYFTKLSKLTTFDLVQQSSMGICLTCVNNLKISYDFLETLSLTQSSWRKYANEIAEGVEVTSVSEHNSDGSFLKTQNSETVYIKSELELLGKENINCVDQESSNDEEDQECDPSEQNFSDANSDTFLCDKCLEPFTTEEQFSSHDCRPNEPRKKKKSEKNAIDVVYKCATCDLVYNKRWKLHKHISRIHEQVKKYICHFCSKSFKQSYHLKEHLTCHTGEKNFICDFCGKRFQRSSSVKRHMKSHEAPPGQKTKRTPFLCNICGKSFPFSNGVQRHMRVHLGIKRHECNICHRRFTQSTHLHVHMRTHTGEKPYICDTCGEAFALNARLQKHISSVHENGSNEPSLLPDFICHYCGETFMEKNQLEGHIGSAHNQGEILKPCQIMPDDISDIKLFY